MNTKQTAVRTLKLVGLNLNGEKVFKLTCPCCTVTTYGTKAEFLAHSKALKTTAGN